MRTWSQLWWFGLATLAALSCNPLWGIDELSYEPTTATTAAAGGTSSATGGGQVGGGGEGGTSPVPLMISHLWSKPLGGLDVQRARALAVDKDSNVLVTGEMQGSLDIGSGLSFTSAGLTDIFLVKLNSSGKHLWSWRLGEAEEQFARGLAVDGSGNVVLVGYYRGTIGFSGSSVSVSSGLERDLFMIKLSAQGEPLWAQSFGGDSGQYGYDVALAEDDSIALTGTFEGTVSFGGSALVSAGDNDILVARFESTGEHKWSKRFGDSLEQKAQSVAIDALGNVLISGYVRGGVDFGGGTLAGGDNHDIFIAKLDSAGEHLWSKRFGDFAEQNAWDLAVDSAGNVTLTGDFIGNVDFGGGMLSSAGDRDIYLARFDANGKHLWSKRFGDTKSQRAFALDVDPTGRILLLGEFAGSVDFGGGGMKSAGQTDVFLAAFGPNGQLLGGSRWGDDQIQYGKAVAFNGNKAALLLGDFYGSIDFGGESMTSTAESDVFIAKLGYE